MIRRKLYIEVECVPFNESDKQYSKLLEIREIPRGLKISVTHYITNIDNLPYSFYIKEISTTLIEPISRKPYVGKETPAKTFNLSPKIKTRLHNTTMQMPFEGNGEFECILKPCNDNEEIEYFRSGNQPLGIKSWT